MQRSAIHLDLTGGMSPAGAGHACTRGFFSLAWQRRGWIHHRGTRAGFRASLFVGLRLCLNARSSAEPPGFSAGPMLTLPMSPVAAAAPGRFAAAPGFAAGPALTVPASPVARPPPGPSTASPHGENCRNSEGLQEFV